MGFDFLRSVTWDEHDEQFDLERRFRVYQHYGGNLAQFLLHEYRASDPPALLHEVASQVRASRSFRKLHVEKAADLDRVERLMGLSFANSMQLHQLAATGRSMLRYVVSAAPTHAYYSTYMAAQAWLSASMPTNIPSDHSATLSTLSTVVTKRTLMPSPWNAPCTGCCIDRIEKPTIGNTPAGIDVTQHFEQLARPTIDSFWPRYAKQLETTRRKQLDLRFDDWKRRRGRKKMYAAEKQSVEKLLPATTIFDYMYRMRIKAHYRDARLFMNPLVDDDELWDYWLSTAIVAGATAIIFDTLLIAKIGRKEYERLTAKLLPPRAVANPVIEPVYLRRDTALAAA